MMLMPPPQPTGAFAWVQEPWGRGLRCTALSAPHLFTSRDLALGDDQGEWTAVSKSMEVDLERLLLIRQVHGTDAAIRRKGTVSPWRRPQADIIISDDPAVAVGVRVADCAPILLFDVRTNVVGAVHAGWRGTAAGVARAAIQAMETTFGCKPAGIVAAIGPCLGACCGEMGPEVVDLFRAAGHSSGDLDHWFTIGKASRPYLDLERANRDQLVSMGVATERIHASGFCTKTNRDRMHSYRADGARAGRLLAAIRAPAGPTR
jgi:polyphenol oxidase